jgi:predicted nucleic acid-binding protein
MKGQIFVDASAWIALFDKSDQFRPRAATYWQRLQREQRLLITSDYVLNEAYTLIRRGRSGLPMAISLHNLVESSHLIDVVPVDPLLRAQGWELFIRYDDKVLSFTDCVSFALMRQRGLFEVFSFDEDFARAGFVVRP